MQTRTIPDTTIVLRAPEDESVNFVFPAVRGAFEARYVRRTTDYFIAYVSSQTGCDRSCRFCHLTATGQTSMDHAEIDDLVEQIEEVLRHHASCDVRPTRMHVNFMARGEPLLNPVLLDRDKWILFRERVIEAADRNGVVDVRFNVSTIVPEGIDLRSLSRVFTDGDVTLYYSLYSLRPAFRRRWLPKAADPITALNALTDWQTLTGQPVALHWAFIQGENDDEEVVREIVAAVRDAGLKAKFNAVRYNPFDERRGREPSQDVVERNFAILADAFGTPDSRIVPRVGFSVKASCGMFVDTTSCRATCSPSHDRTV